MHTNQLINETSPYLLQHAHNPVDWHPWGEAAFAAARESGKPIFLSIGYSTCYWCHVMERLVFENEDIAARMNAHFVNVKVDREERPDIDDIYMAAVQIYAQLTTGRAHGGWPMSVFLTPPGARGGDDRGLEPFFAGTYFPPQPTHGMPSFPQVVEGLANAWSRDREDVITKAGVLAGYVTKHLQAKQEAGPVNEQALASAKRVALRMYDPEFGGFGQAPKFPQPAVLGMLLQLCGRPESSDAQLTEAVHSTLDAMARGGMYDQLGGGFHRYSTDAKWLVPHFEKMLYDNGQLIEVYLEARRQLLAQRGDGEVGPGLAKVDERIERYARIARETCDYVLREMVDQTGAFWSAQDAEVDAREGDNYLWTREQVEAALDDEPELAAMAVKMYGLDAGPNFQDPHDASAPPRNVLHLPRTLREMAAEQGATFEAIGEQRKRIIAKLLAVRDQRKQPGTDDKVLASWNGMMIAGLARAGRELSEPRYVHAAFQAARAILSHMTQADKADAGLVLARSMRDGRSRVAGFLEDYAFIAHGLIECHRAADVDGTAEDNLLTAPGDDSSQSPLEIAGRLMRSAIARFDASPQCGGGYFDTLADQSDVFVRTRTTHDGATPAGASQMVHNLIDLHELGLPGDWLDRAVLDLRSYAASLNDQPMGMVHMLGALARLSDSNVAQTLAAGGEDDAAGADSESGVEATAVEVMLTPGQLTVAGGEARGSVRLTIASGLHINAHKPGAAGLVGLEVALDAGAGRAEADDWRLDVAYPQPESRQPAGSDDVIAVHEGVVEVGYRLSWAGNRPPAAGPTIAVSWQACTDRECLPPGRVSLPVPIVVDSWR